MSSHNQSTNLATSNFISIFDAASNEYKKLTKQDLHTHPLADQIHNCDSPDAVLVLFQRQAEAFDEFCKGDDRLMKWLDPTVHILFTFSATLGEGIALPFPPARTISTGIAVLLEVAKDVVASHGMLVRLFERMQYFLERLNIYTGIPLTTKMTDLLGKIMAQLLSILALSTKEMTQRRIKKFLNRLIGRTEIEDALQRLDMLTKEETGMTVARNLAVGHAVEGIVTAIKDGIDDQKRNQSRAELRRWLAPPDPSVNHNIACDLQHGGTATWFIQSSIFEEWKTNGSLLWIRGNPGSGKSILCSSIIKNIKLMQKTRSALIAYYYFDFKDLEKRDLRGLLCSLLTQLCKDSDLCWAALSQLYTVCDDGSEQPSETALARCLNDILELPGQVPIYIIVDAIDECPNTTGTPSPREKVLDFIEHLGGSNHSNLYFCATSRPEQDIQSILNPLAPGSRRVSLHEEGGQREDITNYVRYFVYNDKAMRRWRTEDKEYVIHALTERADGMFRWVFCQLDTLRRCMPSSIRKALDELPITLDDTYTRTLECIPGEKWSHAHRLFQCLIAAIRPLRIEELAEIFAIEFDSNGGPNFVEGWRPEDPEDAILSACSSLITVVDVKDSKIVQFSHFSVKEFLTSTRLTASNVVAVSRYHVPLEPAHTILAHACLAVLLQLDDKTDKKRLSGFPLAFYAAEHWVDHAKIENVVSEIENAMERLFDPKKQHLAAWTWIYDILNRRRPSMGKLAEYPSPPDGTPLFYAALCGFSCLANHLINTHGEDINAECGDWRWTPLRVASSRGQVEVVQLLLHHNTNVNARCRWDWTPLHSASQHGHTKVAQLLLGHGADVNVRNDYNSTPLTLASYYGKFEVVRLLLGHGADVHVKDDGGRSALDWATQFGHTETAQLLLEHGAKRG
ncbi:hypothetical protein BJV78DRAFT_728169 [Lactifluus subvellereus]|nr:hypothetical protein BJV78DRAFT_728169 [Lactifluus subvellereus]